MQPSPSSGSNTLPRWLVESAESYVDMVKRKFINEPMVYKDFIEILERFKNGTVDTPGVLQRVSVLFHGYPDLIQGFNSYLPPGFRISEHRNNDAGYAFQLLFGIPRSTNTEVPNPQPQQPPPPTMLCGASGTITSNNVSSNEPPDTSHLPQAAPFPSTALEDLTKEEARMFVENILEITKVRLERKRAAARKLNNNLPGTNPTDAAAGSSTEPPKKVISLEEENRLLKNARLCKICMDAELSIVFLPCGHLASCVQCASNLEDCPVCRCAINTTVKTFLS